MRCMKEILLGDVRNQLLRHVILDFVVEIKKLGLECGEEEESSKNSIVNQIPVQ